MAESGLENRSPITLAERFDGYRVAVQLVVERGVFELWRRRRESTLRSMRAALLGTRWFAALGTPATKDLRFPRINTGFPPYPILSIFVANVAWHRQSDGALEPEILCSPITH